MTVQRVKPLPYEHQYPSVNLQSTRESVGDWERSVMVPVDKLEDGAGESREGGELESRVCATGKK